MVQFEAKSVSLNANIASSGTNRLFVSCEECGEGCIYGFVLFCDEGQKIELDWGKENFGVFWVTETGHYHAKVTVIFPDHCRIVGYSNVVEYKGNPIILKKAKENVRPLHNVCLVLNEIWKNRERMFRIAMYDYRMRDKDSYLGKIWSVLNPLIQILTFWFVFGLGIRSGKSVDGHPFLIWMLCGLLAWFFINAGIVGGSNAVYIKAGIVLRMQYPLATLPIGNILVSFFDHLIAVSLLLVIQLFYGYIPSVVWLNILYYWFYGIAFLSSLALITSTLTMVARDFQKLIVSMMRLLFYMTPILWTLDTMPTWAQSVLKLNPLLYIIDGYRDSLLYGINFWTHITKASFFWIVNFILLTIGSCMQRKYKNAFIDLL